MSGRLGAPLAAHLGQHLDAAGLLLRALDRVGRGIDLQAAFGEIVHRLHDVAVGHLGECEPRLLGEVVEGELGDAGHRGRVPLAGLRARAFHEIGKVGDVRCDAGAATDSTVDEKLAIGRMSSGL